MIRNSVYGKGSVSQLLFLNKLVKECKPSLFKGDLVENYSFIHLMRNALKDKNTALKGSLSSVSYLFGLQILNLLDPVLIPSEAILSKIIRLAYNKGNVTNFDKYPRFIVYLLQNANKVSFEEFRNREKTSIPITADNLKTANFVFESTALFLKQ